MATEAQIDEIVDLVNPRPDFRPQCREHVIACIKEIASFDAAPPGSVRETYEKVADILNRAHNVINQLPSVERLSLMDDAWLSKTKMMEQASRTRAAKIPVVASGGQIVNAARMLLCAERAFDLITVFDPISRKGGGEEPRTKRCSELADVRFGS